MQEFKLVAPYEPRGDQPKAIKQLVEGVKKGLKNQVLLGVTGSGKTFTIANLLSQINRPTLIISHNKTLAAQLYSEFKEFFPHSAIRYFISFYDYYQPEAYIPQTDTYIEKDCSINDEIDRLRLAATQALLERRDVIIVASVSCIYNLGSPTEYCESLLNLKRGGEYPRQEILKRLIGIQYERNDYEFVRGNFRVRGDTIEIFPAYEEKALRIELFGDEIDRIREIDPITGKVISDRDEVFIYPAKHFMTSSDRLKLALISIEEELQERLKEIRSQNKLLEARRLEVRTRYDLEMLREVGYCSGIENYSRHLSGRQPGERPSCLIDYFPQDWFLVIDESHVTIPQLRGMYEGDRARKECLIEHGFRLPSALDNRPLKFEEFVNIMPQTVYLSATPGPYELEIADQVVEQIIRPTGLVDPPIEVRPTEGQIEDLIREVRRRIRRKERILVTTLTKRMAEDLADYLNRKGVNVRYLHSEITALKRVDILRDLRLGEFDVLVGINLLREGLDLPEVSLVAILDADKEGFLRSDRALIQVIGRTARNIGGAVIMYGDEITGSMGRAIDETNRRRKLQMDYNLKHGITSETIKKAIYPSVSPTSEKRIVKEARIEYKVKKKEDLPKLLTQLEGEMEEAAERLDYERAAMFRDEIFRLRGIS
ncbi:TPA: excinuclease ABC subunit B [bacterium]|nr:excinuclease ABC subunit B [bacterium]